MNAVIPALVLVDSEPIPALDRHQDMAFRFFHLSLGSIVQLSFLLHPCCCRREEVAPGITRASLEEKWQAKVEELEAAGQPVAAPEAAMSGAILIR